LYLYANPKGVQIKKGDLPPLGEGVASRQGGGGPKDSKILPLNIVSTINNKTNIMSLVISSVFALFYYILPLLDTSKMYTFKVMDFKL